MKTKNLFLMILFIVFLSCEKHEENSSSNPIVGYWELVKISGGFSGKIWTPDECAYLNIKSDSSFGFYNATGRLAVGTITTETDSNNDVWYWFNIDSTKSSFDAPLPMSTTEPKRATLYDANHSHCLSLSDPCCDMFQYDFEKVKEE